MRPRVTLDSEIGYSYIYLGEPTRGVVKISVPLTASRDDPAAVGSLVLDFDADGRLFGIEVANATGVLRPELLEDVDQLKRP